MPPQGQTQVPVTFVIVNGKKIPISNSDPNATGGIPDFDPNEFIPEFDPAEFAQEQQAPQQNPYYTSPFDFPGPQTQQQEPTPQEQAPPPPSYYEGPFAVKPWQFGDQRPAPPQQEPWYHPDRLIPTGLRAGGGIAGGIAGGAAGSIVPGAGTLGGVALGGGVGSYVGDALAQGYEYLRGDRPEGYDVRSGLVEGGLGAIPFMGKAPAMTAPARQWFRHAATAPFKGAVEGGVLGGASPIAHSVFEKGELPSWEEVKGGAKGGAIFGAGTAGAFSTVPGVRRGRAAQSRATAARQATSQRNWNVGNILNDVEVPHVPIRPEGTVDLPVKRTGAASQPAYPVGTVVMIKDMPGVYEVMGSVAPGSTTVQAPGRDFMFVRNENVVPLDAPPAKAKTIDVEDIAPPTIEGESISDYLRRSGVDNIYTTPDEAIANQNARAPQVPIGEPPVVPIQTGIPETMTLTQAHQLRDQLEGMAAGMPDHPDHAEWGRQYDEVDQFITDREATRATGTAPQAELELFNPETGEIRSAADAQPGDIPLPVTPDASASPELDQPQGRRATKRISGIELGPSPAEALPVRPEGTEDLTPTTEEPDWKWKLTGGPDLPDPGDNFVDWIKNLLKNSEGTSQPIDWNRLRRKAQVEPDDARRQRYWASYARLSDPDRHFIDRMPDESIQDYIQRNSDNPDFSTSLGQNILAHAQDTLAMRLAGDINFVPQTTPGSTPVNRIRPEAMTGAPRQSAREALNTYGRPGASTPVGQAIDDFINDVDPSETGRSPLDYDGIVQQVSGMTIRQADAYARGELGDIVYPEDIEPLIDALIRNPTAGTRVVVNHLEREARELQSQGVPTSRREAGAVQGQGRQLTEDELLAQYPPRSEAEIAAEAARKARGEKTLDELEESKRTPALARLGRMIGEDTAKKLVSGEIPINPISTPIRVRGKKLRSSEIAGWSSWARSEIRDVVRDLPNGGVDPSKPGIEVVPHDTPDFFPDAFGIIWRNAEGKPMGGLVSGLDGKTVSIFAVDPALGLRRGAVSFEILKEAVNRGATKPSGGTSDHTKNLFERGIKLIQRAAREESGEADFFAMIENAKRLADEFAKSGFAQRIKRLVKDESGSVPLKHPTAQRWQAILEELDAENAPDIKYRDIMSTGSKNALKRGEKWRDRVVKGIQYFEDQAKRFITDESGTFDPAAAFARLRELYEKGKTGKLSDAEVNEARTLARQAYAQDAPAPSDVPSGSGGAASTGSGATQGAGAPPIPPTQAGGGMNIPPPGPPNPPGSVPQPPNGPPRQGPEPRQPGGSYPQFGPTRRPVEGPLMPDDRFASGRQHLEGDPQWLPGTGPNPVQTGAKPPQLGPTQAPREGPRKPRVEFVNNNPQLVQDLLDRVRAALEQKAIASGNAAAGPAPINKILAQMQQVIRENPEADTSGIVRQVLGANKALLTSWDLSAPGRQGKAFILNKEWWTALPGMVKAWGSKGAADLIQKAIEDHPSGYFKRGVSQSGKPTKSLAELVGLELSETEEMFASTAGQSFEKYSGIGKSSRAHTAFLNKLRSDMFVNFMESAKAAGRNPEVDLDLAKKYATFINDATGRGSVNIGKWKLERNISALNDGFFAPKNMAGQIRTWNNVLNPIRYYQHDPVLRKQALKSLFAVAGVGMMTAEAADQIPGVRVGHDPTSADFMKVIIGNKRIDLFGGYQQFPVAAMQFALGQKTPTTGKNAGKTQDLSTGGYYNRASEAEKFFVNRLSPVGSFAWAWMRGREFDGKPFEVKRALYERTLPIVTKDLMELAQSDPAMAAMLSPLLVSGLAGTQVYTGR